VDQVRLSVYDHGDVRQLNLGSEGWDERAAELYTARGCAAVGLDPTVPYGDLDFLRSLPGLRGLSMGAAKVKDMAAVFDLTGLEELGAGLNIRDLRGLSRLTRLRVLAVPYRKGFEEIAGLTELEELAVEDWPKDTDLLVLGPKPRLRQLFVRLKRSAAVSSSWFPNAPELTELSLHSGVLTDTAGLAALTRLESLELTAMKLPDLDFVSAMPGLRKLEVDNAGDIVSLAPLRGHPSLTELYVIGNTRVLDGDLDVRADLPSLRTGSIGNRPFGTGGDESGVCDCQCFS